MQLFRSRFGFCAAACLAGAIGGRTDFALGANPNGVGREAALATLKEFSVPDGLEVSLFAAEPQVRNPANMDVDERGRVWVTEGANYRSTFQKWGTLDPAGDRIMILEDTDHDGVADKETVFYQDPSVNTALGICVLGNRVIVSRSPNVFVLTDTDGDGRADQRELLFTGIAGVDHDHGVHAFVFGPDGKLYFNMGNEGKQLAIPQNRKLPLHGPVDNVPSRMVVDLEGNEVRTTGKPYRNGLVFRCDLDGSRVETLAWNFRNNYEVAVDSFGGLWQSDNDDDGNRGVRINFLLDHGNYGFSDEITGAAWGTGWQRAQALLGLVEDEKVMYEWHQYDPGVVPNLLHTGAGSPTGIAIYEGTLLPETFRGQLLHCDAGPRVVRAYCVTPKGAGYTATITNLLATTNSWFRPSDVCVAPDGSVYVADWNDAGVGGHYMADQSLETMTGRIYRVAPKGHKPSIPRLDLNNPAGCVQALCSPNLATSSRAWLRLHEMGPKAEVELAKLFKDGEADPRLRARALRLLARIPGREKAYVEAGLDDRNSDLRITSLRIARETGTNLVPCLRKLVRDPSPQVRRECALALRQNHSPEAAGLWAILASQHVARDRWSLEALGIGADGQWDPFLQAFEKSAKTTNDPVVRGSIVWRSRGTNSPLLLASVLPASATPAEAERWVRAFDFISDPEKTKALLQLVSSRLAVRNEIALAALGRLAGTDAATNAQVQDALKASLDWTRGTARFIEFVRAFRVPGQEAALLTLALQSQDGNVGAEAMRLAMNGAGREIVQQALGGAEAARVIQALGNCGDRAALPLLEVCLSETNRDTAQRKVVVKAMAQTRDGTSRLLQLADNGKLPVDLKLAASSELSRVRWEDLRSKAAKVLPPPASRNSQPLPPISELAGNHGDATRGSEVFRREGPQCLKCHQVNGEGVDFGPNLSEIGAKLAREALYEAILDPSAGISFGYEAWEITQKNGDQVTGLLASETADEIAVKAVGGVVTRYPKAEVAARTRSKLSIMPAGAQESLTPEELVDLVEYLSSLKKARTGG